MTHGGTAVKSTLLVIFLVFLDSENHIMDRVPPIEV